MRRLKGCTNGNASTAWDYACVMCNLFPKRFHHSQTSRAQSPLNHFYTWCNTLLTGLHHSPVVSIPLFLPSNSSILPLHLPSLHPSITCTRVHKLFCINHIIIIIGTMSKKRLHELVILNNSNWLLLLVIIGLNFLHK